jgi:hypothetical protein
MKTRHILLSLISSPITSTCYDTLSKGTRAEFFRSLYMLLNHGILQAEERPHPLGRASA